MEDGVRKPQSGVDIRLLRPGADWQSGSPPKKPFAIFSDQICSFQ